MTDTRPAYQIALDAIPGYRDADAALNRIKKRNPITRPAANTDQLLEEALTAARAGHDLPEDLGRRAADANRAHEFAVAEERIIRAVLTQLTHYRDEALRRGVDHALTALNEPLHQVLNDAQSLAPTLAGVTSASDAIKTGPEAASNWARLTQLADRHRGIRTAQIRLMNAAHPEEGGIDVSRYLPDEPQRMISTRQVMLVASWFSNLDELWPHWKPVGRGLSDTAAADFAASSAPPWPHVSGNPLGLIADDPETVLWCATSEADCWIPTIGEAIRTYLDATAAQQDRDQRAWEIREHGAVLSEEERHRLAAEAQRKTQRQNKNLQRRAHNELLYGKAAS